MPEKRVCMQQRLVRHADKAAFKARMQQKALAVCLLAL